jgi:CheY-like chemotaxis protein
VFEAACRPFELQAKVHTANSVHGAIDICRQEDFDMLCLDHNIEGITGWELLDYLRPHLRNAKVIIYSAGVDESSQQEYARRRVIGILKKPLSPAALGFSIRKALGI